MPLNSPKLKDIGGKGANHKTLPLYLLIHQKYRILSRQKRAYHVFQIFYIFGLRTIGKIKKHTEVKELIIKLYMCASKFTKIKRHTGKERA